MALGLVLINYDYQRMETSQMHYYCNHFSVYVNCLVNLQAKENKSTATMSAIFTVVKTDTNALTNTVHIINSYLLNTNLIWSQTYRPDSICMCFYCLQ